MAVYGAPHQVCFGMGRESVSPTTSPAPIKPLIRQGRKGSPTRGRMGAQHGPQPLSDSTSEGPFHFRLVGFGFVSSSEELLEPDFGSTEACVASFNSGGWSELLLTSSWVAWRKRPCIPWPWRRGP